MRKDDARNLDRGTLEAARGAARARWRKPRSGRADSWGRADLDRQMAGAMPAWRLGRLNAMPVPGRPPERDGQADIGLTGGQRRIFAVSRALLLKPAVLLLDEPTTGADPIGRREMLQRVPLKGKPSIDKDAAQFQRVGACWNRNSRASFPAHAPARRVRSMPREQSDGSKPRTAVSEERICRSKVKAGA